MTRLLIAERADTQIRAIATWWLAHREKSPGLFAEELADTLEAVVRSPGLGQRYRVVAGVEVKRLLLPRSRYHLYFSHYPREDIVRVRAIWHASRGRGPLLR